MVIIIIIVEVIIDDGGKWDNIFNYSGQLVSGRNEYCNPIYTDIMKIMLEKISTGKDAFGNPIYGWFYFCFFRLIFI